MMDEPNCLQRVFHGGLRDTERHRGHQQTAEIEVAHRHLECCVLLAN
jgi:hypothetical protein